MILGDARTFAIESEISVAYERLGFWGLGFFVIHLDGMMYGVKAPDATPLACSFDEVGRRLESRGKHDASVFRDLEAGKVADAVTSAIYAEEEAIPWLGGSQAELRKVVYANGLLWAPDGDEAFDDGGHILQFDVEDRVQLIGFRHNGHRHEPPSLREVWLKGESFYSALREWQAEFLAQWQASPKEPHGI